MTRHRVTNFQIRTNIRIEPMSSIVFDENVSKVFDFAKNISYNMLLKQKNPFQFIFYIRIFLNLFCVIVTGDF